GGWREEAVDREEVGVLAARPEQIDAAFAGDRPESERQVVVDVRVHAGERELERRDPALPAAREERLPRARSSLRVFERGEVEVRERDVQAGEEGGVGEGRARELGLHR